VIELLVSESESESESESLLLTSVQSVGIGIRVAAADLGAIRVLATDRIQGIATDRQRHAAVVVDIGDREHTAGIGGAHQVGAGVVGCCNAGGQAVLIKIHALEIDRDTGIGHPHAGGAVTHRSGERGVQRRQLDRPGIDIETGQKGRIAANAARRLGFRGDLNGCTQIARAGGRRVQNQRDRTIDVVVARRGNATDHDPRHEELTVGIGNCRQAGATIAGTRIDHRNALDRRAVAVQNGAGDVAGEITDGIGTIVIGRLAAPHQQRQQHQPRQHNPARTDPE